MAVLNSSDPTIEIKTYPIRLRERGQITVPQAVRERLAVTDGDILTLFQVGELILLTPKQPQVPQLADKISALMEQEGVTLADLLTGLAQEREAIRQERRQNA